MWIIPSFRSILRNKYVRGIRSPKVFTQSTMEPLKFELIMKFFGEERQWIEIYYSTSKSGVLPSVQVNIIFDNNWDQYSEEYQTQSVVVTSKTREIVEANKWQYLTYLTEGHTDVRQLYIGKTTKTNIITVLEDGSLRLSFYFGVTIENDKKDKLVSINSEAPTHPPATQMFKDLESIFNDPLYSDVSLKSADDKEFKVHKVLLASRSPVLRAHFEHNFTESITKIVESPLDSEVLREVLSFIYTDKAKIEEFPEKLLAAADYYQLSELKSRCEDAMQKKLTVENAIETFELANLYQANILKQNILEFIKYDGLFSQIIKTEGWNKLQSVDLIKEICDYCN